MSHDTVQALARLRAQLTESPMSARTDTSEYVGLIHQLLLKIDTTLTIARRSTQETLRPLEELRELLEQRLQSAIQADHDPAGQLCKNHGSTVDLEQLTSRELQVLRLICQGLANRQIARSLGLAEKTVKNYVHAIFRKLNVTCRTEAAILAIQHDWCRNEESR